jgi:predicted transposase/invertase (TIGR01784 family)
MANFLDPKEAVEYMKKAAYTKEQLDLYDKWKIAAMTERSALKDAKKEGILEGIITTALKMLKDGMTIENVGKYTGLSKEQIEELKN